MKFCKSKGNIGTDDYNRNLHYQPTWNNSTPATYLWWTKCSKFN